MAVSLEAPPTTDRTAARVAAGASVLFAIAMFVTVASIDVPTDSSDAELVRWWGEAANRTSGLVSCFAAIAAALLLPAVVNHVASGASRLAAYARSAAVAFGAAYLATGAARGVVAHLVDRYDQPVPSADVLRFATGLNYTLLAYPGMAALGVTMLAVSVLVLRTGVLGRWAGWAGAVLGAVVLAAMAAGVGAFATPLAVLWGLLLAVEVWRRA